MKNEFVSYEIALALEELGFESPYPIGGYQGGKVFYYENGELYYDGRPMYSSDAHSGQLLAPLYQQAFKWFENTYGLFVDRQTMCSVNEVMSMDYYIHSINGTWKIDLPADYSEFDSYKANTACLEKLIEIVKAQKE